MGFDYENQRFTPENHLMLDSQMVPSVSELVPGDVGYVDEEHIFLDAAKRVWIYRNAAVYQMEDVIDEFVDCYHAEEEPPHYLRLIHVNQGLILDESGYDRYDWSSGLDRFTLEGAERVAQEPEQFLPIIHRIFNLDELELIDQALDDNNIFLDETEFEDILDLAGEQAAAEEKAFLAGEDEEPEGEET